MIALIWILLAWLTGWIIFHAAVPDPHLLLQCNPTEKTSSPWPSFLFQFSASLMLGLLLNSWLTYLFAAALNRALPESVHPLLVANLMIMITAITVFGIYFSRQRFHFEQSKWPVLVRSIQSGTGFRFVLLIVFWCALAYWLMHYTFYQTGDYLHAGYSVFGDFAPHTALTASFSEGRNWPTQYPHFGGDGISYHFMYYFLCANLYFLDLPMEWAINLPSILSLVSFCLLLGSLAYRLTGRLFTYLLTPLLLFFRSSTAFWSHLVGLLQEAHQSGRTLNIMQSLLNQRTFIGSTTHDDWGLWGVNVYANQRHFLSGLSLALIVLLLILPDVKTGLANNSISRFFRRDTWLIHLSTNRKRLVPALLIMLFLPYWHGSALVWLLLVLVPLALFANNRLSFLTLGLTALTSALVQSRFFSGHATQVVKPAILIGFLADDDSFLAILKYLLLVTGILIPLVIAAFVMKGTERKLVIISLFMPVIFTFTVSLTPDVTVNHKFLIASIAILNIYIADLISHIWQKKRKMLPRDPVTGRFKAPLIMKRILVGILVILLTITGVEEWIIVKNINVNTVSIQLNSSLAVWIKDHTDPDALFVTAPYHYHSFFLSGRSVFLGHTYYAWSAGHDTAGRQRTLTDFLSASDHELEQVRSLIKDNHLSYLLLDDTLRNHEDYSVDELFFDKHFLLVASFPDENNAKIYDLQSIH